MRNNKKIGGNQCYPAPLSFLRNPDMVVIFLFHIFLLMITGTVYSQSSIAADSATSKDSLDFLDTESFVDSLLHTLSDSFHVPGLVISIVHGDQYVLSKGYGYADLGKKIPMTLNTVVRAGSVSKPITATAVIQLVEQGLIDLEEPIDKYISQLDLNDGLGPASTTAELLNHMGGYPDQIILSHSPSVDKWSSLEEVLISDLPSRAFAPGKIMSYSSWDYALLGYLIEQTSNNPYEKVIESNLLEPLGMTNSTYLQPLPDHINEKLAIGYGYVESRQSYKEIPHDFVRMSPGVAFVTTAADMARYMTALLNHGKSDNGRVLRKETIPLLFERQASVHPYSRGRSYAFPELSIAGRKVLYHDGNGIGFSSRIVLMPDYEFGMFISTNHRSLTSDLSASQASSFLRLLSAEILRKFMPESTIEIPKAQHMVSTQQDLKKFTGHYRIAHVPTDDFFKMEALMNYVDVKSTESGQLLIGSGSYMQVEPRVFQNERVPSFFVVFVEGEKKGIDFLSFGGTGSYQKVTWFENANLNKWLFGICALVFVSMLFIWPFKKHGHWLAPVIAVVNLIFLTGLGVLFRGGIDLLVLFKSIPIKVQVLLAIPWLNLVLSTWLLVVLIRRIGKHEKFSWSKLHYSILLLSSFLLIWLSFHWNVTL